MRYRFGFGVVLKENTSSFFLTLKMFELASVAYPADFPLVVDFFPDSH